jgi:hypothetical protein
LMIIVFIQTRLRVGTEKQSCTLGGKGGRGGRAHKETQRNLSHSVAYLVGATLIATLLLLLLITLLILFTTQIVE